MSPSSSCISFSSNSSKEEGSFSNLSKEEKEKILNHNYNCNKERLYNNNNVVNNDVSASAGDNNNSANHNNNGNNINANNNNNNIEQVSQQQQQQRDREQIITDDLLDEFHNEIDKIPLREKEDYMNAEFFVPEIIDRESNPEKFLLTENCDAKKAAYRLVEYWKLRCTIFDENGDAFKPILSLEDTMKSTLSTFLEIPTYATILPNDIYGRKVICFDRTNVSFKEYDENNLAKIIWYVIHYALLNNNNNNNNADDNSNNNNNNNNNGLVIIAINTSLSWDFPSHRFCKICTETLIKCLPIKVESYHFILSSLVATCVLPIVKLFGSPQDEEKQKDNPHYYKNNKGLYVHNVVKKQTMLHDLSCFGLVVPNGVPRSIGGSYNNEKSIWINECEYILSQERQRQRTKKQRRELHYNNDH